ncbi:MAG: hypothetical protein SAL70_34475, partial [Scytonema sp. PMC 1070.18]|nr:hypothetical protein [Scytonema sp. PMC 1070.18]
MPQYSRDINIEKSTSGIQTRVNLINATVFIKASHKWRSQLVTYDKNTILPYTPQRQLTRVGRYTHTTHFST